MATNIEQIFRSFVVTKFREIQEQRFGGGKIGSQYNGEINSPEHISSSDDTIGSVGNLQNDPLVQKIEQVLSEVLGAESQYKPDDEEDVARNKSRSTKRGLSEEVQDEIPRKKSKKDKKHKDKKKKKKRKKEKEKKHKKQSKESDLNDQEKACGDIEPVLHSKPENSSFILSAVDDTDADSVSLTGLASVSVLEKATFENQVLVMPNSHSTSLDSGKLDTSKEDSPLLSSQELSEVKLASERKVENDVYKPTSLTPNSCTEDQTLRTAEVEADILGVVNDVVLCIEQSEVDSPLESAEKLNVSENRMPSVEVQLEDLETSVESGVIEGKQMDSVTGSLNLEGWKQSASTSLEPPAFPHLEASGEAKDSVTTLGFLAMVVGKDFEATSEFLNTAKVKAFERSPKYSLLADVKDDSVHDSERLITMQDLQKALQSRAEVKDSEAAPESLHIISEKILDPAVMTKLKPPQAESNRIIEFSEQMCTPATSRAETLVRELRKTPGFKEATQVNSSLGKSFMEEEQASEIVQNSELITEVKIPENISQSEAVSSIIGIERTPDISEIVKSQNLEVSKDTSPNKISETVLNLKDMEKVSESSMTLKNVESTSESQHVKQMNYMDDLLQSDKVSQNKDVETNLEAEGNIEQKDMDATSESLHMIFTNYSEQNLELHTELKDMLKLKSSEIVPQSSYMVDTKHLESQHIKKVKDLKMVESEMMVGLNDLQKKIESLHRNVKIVEAALECKALSHWAALEGKASDITENKMADQNDATADDLQIPSSYEKGNDDSKTTENELGAENEDQLLTSKSSKEIDAISSETVSELETITLVQKLKENVEFTTRIEEHSPQEVLQSKSSLSTDLKENSKSANAVKCVELFPESLQDTKAKEMNLSSLYDLDGENRKRSPEFEITDELSNREAKQKYEERTGLVASSETLYVLEKESIHIPEAEKDNEIVSTESVCLAESNSDNALKSFCMIQVKNSVTTSESKIPDKVDSRSTLKAGVKVAENVPECATVVVLEMNSIVETPKKNELLEPQVLSSLHESESVLKNKASTIINVGTPTETVCLCEKEKLKIVPCQESAVKKPGDSSSLFTKDIVDVKTIPYFAHEAEVTVAEAQESSESANLVKETFQPNSMMFVKGLEASQKLETTLEENMNYMHTELFQNTEGDGVETFKRSESTITTQISESLLTGAGKVEEKDAGMDVEKDAKVIIHSDSVMVSEKEDCNRSLTEIIIDVRNTESNSGILQKVERNTSTLQLETTSKSQCVVDSMGLDVESKSKVETKEGGQVVSYERVMEVNDSSSPVTTAVQLITPQLKPSESISVSKQMDLPGILNSKATQIYPGTSDFKSGIVAETEILEIIDSEMHLKPKNNSEVKYFEATSEAENLQKTLPVCEKMVENLSELAADEVCPGKMKYMEAILECKHSEQTKDLESSSHSVHAVETTDLERSHISKILEINQFTGVVEAADLGVAVSSETAESVKESEKQLQLEAHFEQKHSETIPESTHASDLQDTYLDKGPTDLVRKPCPKTIAEVAFVIDTNSKSNSELALQLKDAETSFKSRSLTESAHSKESKGFEAGSKCESLEVKDIQVMQTSTVKEQVDFEEMSESVSTSESGSLERNSTSVPLPERETSEGSPDSVCVKSSLLTSEYVTANNKDVSEENLSCTSRAEIKSLDSSAERVTDTKNSEMISHVAVEAKHSEPALESLSMMKEKDGSPQTSVEGQGLKATEKPVFTVAEETLEVAQQITVKLKDSEPVVEAVIIAEKNLKEGEQVTVEAKDSETAPKSIHVTKEKDLEIIVQDSSKDKDSEAVTEGSDIAKECEESILKDKKSEKISSKSKDKSKSSKKTKKSRSKSPSKSKKRKKKSRSRSTTRPVASRRERSRSKQDSHSRKKHSTSYKSRSKSTDKKEDKESRSRRRRSRSKSRSKSVDRRETPVRSRRRRSRSSDHRSRSRSIDKKESVRRRRRLSRSSDKHKSRSRSVERRETVIRSRRRRSRSSDRRKSRSRSVDKRETSVRTRRRRSQSSDRYRSRSKSLDRTGSSVRTRRRQSRSSERRKSRSRSGDEKRELSGRRRRRWSRSPDTRKSRSRSVDRRETTVRTRRRRSRSSDRHKSRSRSVDKSSVRTRRRRSRSSDNCRSKSRSVDKRETSVRTRRRRSRSSDNRRSRSKSVEKRESSGRRRRRRSLSSDRKSRSKSVEKRETSVQVKRKRSRSSETRKSRSKSVDNIETSSKSKRRRSESANHKSRKKSVEKEESTLRSRHRKSKSPDRQVSKSKSRSKSTERKKDKNSSEASREKRSRYRSKSKSVEKTEENESLDITVNNHTKSPEQRKSKSRSKSKSVDKTGERERSRRSRSKSSKSPESRSRRRRTVSRSRRNRSRSLTRRRGSRSKSEHRSRTRSRSRSLSRSRRWRRTRSRSLSRQRSLSRERRRRSRRNRSRSPDRRRRRSDSRDSYRISLRLRSRSRTPVRLRCSRSTGRRRTPSKSPDHRRSRSSSRSPKRLTDLDKAQLLEIAKANAAVMCAKAGVPLPPSLMPVITPEKKEEKVTQKSAKETILELTEKCKKIAQSQEDDVIVNKPHVSDEEEEEHPFINHPFKLNEPKPIFFNLTTPTIKPPAPKNQVTLTKEFPVSSGSQHRKKEADSAYGEWVPVEKDKDEKKDDVFPDSANLEPVDISSALNERTIAQKRLTENTFDLEAMCLLNRAQERIDAWAELNSIPGHFTGSTGAQVLSSVQLSNSGPQAWVKKDQFLRAAPVSGGMGAQLMRKMGWREGEGLGRNKEGNKEPILVDFKTDRKGLVAVGEKAQKRHGPFGALKDLSGKHPVSVLLEVCNKRRWSPPVFVLVNDNRPEYHKHFLFKVMVNGVEHKPTSFSPNKKQAKALAATVALQALGLVSKGPLANATNFRSASHN